MVLATDRILLHLINIGSGFGSDSEPYWGASLDSNGKCHLVVQPGWSFCFSGHCTSAESRRLQAVLRDNGFGNSPLAIYVPTSFDPQVDLWRHSDLFAVSTPRGNLRIVQKEAG